MHTPSAVFTVLLGGGGSQSSSAWHSVITLPRRPSSRQLYPRYFEKYYHYYYCYCYYTSWHSVITLPMHPLFRQLCPRYLSGSPGTCLAFWCTEDCSHPSTLCSFSGSAASVVFTVPLGGGGWRAAVTAALGATLAALFAGTHWGPARGPTATPSSQRGAQV